MLGLYSNEYINNFQRAVVYFEAIQNELDFWTVTEKTDAEKLTLECRDRPESAA